MSKYTTELRYICESLAGDKESSGYSKTADVIERARTKLFDFEYPIFDKEYKKPLETKIIKHFYFNEIGMETYGQFKMFLDARMNEIMPYYNQLYKSEMIKFDPMTDFDYQVTGDKTGTGTKDTTSSNDRERELTSDSNREYTNTGKIEHTISGNTQETVNSKTTDVDNVKTNETRKEDTNGSITSDTNTTDTKMDLYHDTPQGSLQTINDSTYLTNARKITDNNDVGYQGNTNETKNITGNSTSDRNDTVTLESGKKISDTKTDTDKHEDTDNETKQGTENETINDTGKENMQFKNVDEYAEHHFGKSIGKNFSEMLMDFRKTFLNIDAMIIKDLEDLFFGLWNAGI